MSLALFISIDKLHPIVKLKQFSYSEKQLYVLETELPTIWRLPVSRWHSIWCRDIQIIPVWIMNCYNKWIGDIGNNFNRQNNAMLAHVEIWTTTVSCIVQKDKTLQSDKKIKVLSDFSFIWHTKVCYFQVIIMLFINKLLLASLWM